MGAVSQWARRHGQMIWDREPWFAEAIFAAALASLAVASTASPIPMIARPSQEYAAMLLPQIAWEIAGGVIGIAQVISLVQNARWTRWLLAGAALFIWTEFFWSALHSVPLYPTSVIMFFWGAAANFYSVVRLLKGHPGVR